MGSKHNRFLLVIAALFISTPCLAQSQSSVPKPEFISTGQLHISSSNSGSNVFNGVNINELVGAERFYNAGFDGVGVTIGNIEAGHVDNGHSTLEHVTTQITGTGAAGTIDAHATWVTHAMSGRFETDSYPTNYFGYGIAKGSTTISGAIATSFGSGGSFNTTAGSVASVYSELIKPGAQGVINGADVEVDVFNSSWGFNEPTGWNLNAVGVDGFINDTGKIGVFSAGNRGPGINSVGGIGAGYNSITVGSLASDTSSPVYDRVSSFSSRSPNDFRDLDPFTVIDEVRAAVDIAAPGQNLTLAAEGTTNSYNPNLQGTSFSAPIVAGGAALVVNAGKSLYGSNSNAIDGRIVKAVLLNGARKDSQWTNGQALNDGVIETSQALDWETGAGALNLDQTFDQYVLANNGGMVETADVAGTDQGDLGDVGNVGWDFGFVGSESGVDDINLYFLDQQVAAASELTLTLTWFADMISGDDADFSGAAGNHLANLDVTIFEFDNLTDRNIIDTVARSNSLYNVVEHLHFEIENQGFYGIQVDYTGSHFDFDDIEPGEFYGLAWRTTAVPEPMTTVALAMGLAGLAIRRRRRG